MLDEITLGWDWYGCTIEAEWDMAVRLIARRTQSEPVGIGPRSRWGQVWEMHRGESVIATVCLAAERPGEPFIECKSFADELVPIIRDAWPEHRVARMDARLDFPGDDWWYVLEPMCIEYARQRSIFIEPAGAHLQPELGGRTWYFGNRHAKSERLRRLYEKGCELKLRTRGPIRLETQWRPHSRDKALASQLTPQGLLHADHFVRHIASKLQLDLGILTHLPKVERPRGDLDRILDTLARQYLGALQACRERFDNLDQLVDDLCARKARDEELRTMMSAAARAAGPSPLSTVRDVAPASE